MWGAGLWRPSSSDPIWNSSGWRCTARKRSERTPATWWASNQTGVVATAGLQSIAEIEADVCCYLPATNGRLKASIEEVALLLSSG